MRISSNNSLTTQIATSNASESFMVLEKPSSPIHPTSRGIPRERAHKYDIGLYFDCVHGMSDGEKFQLINNVWKPSPNYEFPLTNKRKFSIEWLHLYPSLLQILRWCILFIFCFVWACLAVHKSTKNS